MTKMDRRDRNTLIVSACIMSVFATAPFYLHIVMVAIGNFSTVAAGAFAVPFVGAFFFLFWLRSLSQKRTTIRL